jgi:hypothetical protein
LPSLIDGFLISQKAVNQTLPTAPTTAPESNPVRRDFQNGSSLGAVALFSVFWYKSIAIIGS